MKAIGFVSGMALGMAAAGCCRFSGLSRHSQACKARHEAYLAQHDEQALIPPAQAVTNQHF